MPYAVPPVGARRCPPAVAWPVRADAAWSAFGVFTAAAAAACVAAWSAGHGWTPDAWTPAAALLAGALALIVPREAGVLRWDGTAWWWQSCGGAEQQAPGLVVAIDGGTRLLLRLRLADGTIRWLALAAACDRPGWHALRVALFAGARGSPAPGALAG